jgi:hypothetical protein
MVGQQGRVLLLHNAMPVGIHEGGVDGGGNEEGVRRCIGRQDQPLDGTQNTDRLGESPLGECGRGHGGWLSGGTPVARCGNEMAG